MDALNSSNNPRYPRSTSELEVDERDSKGGKIDRGIELGIEICGSRNGTRGTQ